MTTVAMFIIRRPLASAIFVTLISLVSGVCVFIMADFGEPLWIFVPLLLWLGTIGLPSTVGVLTVATCWGRTPALSGFVLFCVVAATFALALQAGLFVMCSNTARRHIR